MKLTANLGDMVPRDRLTAVGERARKAETDVRELAARAGELTGAVIRRGLLRILDGGGLLVEGVRVDYATQTVTGATFAQYVWGALGDAPRPDGSPQQGLLFKRDDGTTAFEIREGNAADGQYAQAWIFRDRAGNIVLSEDTNSGLGIARPHLSWPTPTPTNTAQWLTHSPVAGDTSWVSIARCEPEPQNPKMFWNVRTVADAGVTAEYRWCWQLDGGVQAPASRTHTLTAPADTYAFGYWREERVPLPDGVTINRRTTLDLQVRMTAGADGAHVAKAIINGLGGDQS